MIEEYKIGNVARDWIVRYQSETERDIMLANINRVMNKCNNKLHCRRN